MINRFLRRFRKAVQPARSRLPDISIAEGVTLRGEDKFNYGKNCVIDVGAYLSCAGGAWNNYAGHITFGDDCEIGPYSVLNGAGGITFGNSVHIGAHVAISANQLKRDKDSPRGVTMGYAPVTIEDGVLVGPNSSIAPGVTIGKNTTIGAGSSVVSDIPPNSIAVGCPARVLAKTPVEAVNH